LSDQARRGFKVSGETSGSIDVLVDARDQTVLYAYDETDSPGSSHAIGISRNLQMLSLRERSE
jgi:hypothetical protein